MNQTEILYNSFKWEDYLNPDQQILVQLAKDLGLAPKVMLNCLDSDYLPHIETYGNKHFIILRLMEPKTKLSADSVQELTTKIAIFLAPEKIISIHRMPLKEVDVVIEKMKNKSAEEGDKQVLLSYFFEQVSLGFDQPLSDLENMLHNFEEHMFNKRKSKNFLQEGFYLKRKASAYKKVLKLTLDLMGKLISKAECSAELIQQSKDRLERGLFYAEDVHESIQSLLNLHVAVESQKTNEASLRTNEIMRVLTVLTLFFLPLNFVAGVFGMNFKEMPLLEAHSGFWVSIVLMLGVSLVLAWYLFRQGWLERPDIKSENTFLKQ